MTTVSSWTVDSATATSNRNLAATTTSTTGSNTLDQSAYLQLLTAQMQYQDPFDPVDNKDMISQMTSFSQLAGQTQANTTLQTIADSLSGSRLSGAASWIGKSMLVPSSTVSPTSEGYYAGQITLAGDASDVTVDLLDSANNVVKTVDLGAQKAGDVPFFWDGKDAGGNTVATGQLTMRVNGATPQQTSAWATVLAVKSPANGSDSTLVTTLGNYSASDALSLS
jgi:flagellar basal-body rod modification protein FlgD